jgi:hypothetical protein
MGPSKPAAGERAHALRPLIRRDQGCRSEPRSSKRYEAFLRRSTADATRLSAPGNWGYQREAQCGY